MAKKYNYLCLWLFFFPAAHFYETFWPRKIWPLPHKKSLCFGVKKLSKHLLKLREEEEGQEKLLPKTLQIWGAQKWVSMTFSDH